MRSRPANTPVEGLRLWSAAVAVLAILLQTLWVGTGAAGQTVAVAQPAASLHHSHSGTRDHGGMAPGCDLCFLCCAAPATSPALEPVVLAELSAAAVTYPRPAWTGWRSDWRSTTRSARGPPDRA